MKIEIREISEQDLAHVIRLMREFAAYEDLSDYCTVTVERLWSAMFADRGYVEGLIAFDGDKAVGYAIFYPSFSSFRGEHSVYLEDIYIDKQYRRHELGLKMLKQIAGIAAKCGCERMDFLVLDWNEPAVNFYLKHGAEKNDDESHFKLSGEAFRRLAS